jgi:hypothetical protein
MSAYERETRRLQPPCPICQGMTFTWGQLNTGSMIMVFTPHDASGWSKLFSQGEPLEARMCEGCGNVQLFRRDRLEI